MLFDSFELLTHPDVVCSVRTAKFVARKQWIVCGSDDMFVRVYNYNTMDKIKSFEAHTDYIRSIAVHPTQPYLLTCSDDMLIKLWDWDKVCLDPYSVPSTPQYARATVLASYVCNVAYHMRLHVCVHDSALIH